MHRSYFLVALLIPAALLLARCKDNPAYCDATTPCADPTTVCVPRLNMCVPSGAGDLGAPPDLALLRCTTASDCPADFPTCKPSGLCARCAVPGSVADCMRFAGTPVCGPAGACVECWSDGDCAAQQKTCDHTTNKCAPCADHTDCTTGVCKPGGACAGPDEVFYVDNHALPVATCAMNRVMTGVDRGHAFCDVASALAATPPRPYVLVAGSPQPYGAVSLVGNGGAITVTIVGPGRTAMPPATLTGSGTSAVSITATGVGSADVTLDGLDLVGSNLASADGVDCIGGGGTASLTIVRSGVHGASGVGVFAKTCTLTLDADAIALNQAGGVALSGATQYAITNSFITGNASTGVTLATAIGRFAFNTVANNGSLAGGVNGGIDCGTGSTKVIEDSIIWGNAQNANCGAGCATCMNKSQFFGCNCQVTNVVTGSDDYNEGNTLSPVFVNLTTPPYDYHLVMNSSANLACCVDKVTAASVDGGAASLPNHDVDYSTRPKGQGWDIGAHEVQ